MVVHANVLLRIFDGPEHPQHHRAVEVLRSGSASGEPLRILPTTLIEVAFVLASPAAGYGVARDVITRALLTVLDDPSLTVSDPLACRRAVELYASHPIDLDDCYVAAVAERHQEQVLSFDADFDLLRSDGLPI